MNARIKENSITEPTRRDLFDVLRVKNVNWSGRLDEVDFLSRIFDLTQMRSTDRRCADAESDIWQHRKDWRDWDDDWVYSDSRFNLLRCDDETFLHFICEMVHPVVRPQIEDAEELVAILSEYLARDGWEVFQQGEVSGKPLFAARLRVDGATVALDHAEEIADALGAEYVTIQINRMQSAITSDTELAIGTAKEFLETISKTILDDCEIEHDNKEVPWLIKNALNQLDIEPTSTKPEEAARAVRRLLSNLAGVGQSVAEVRNQMGTGHGKSASCEELDPAFARLVVGAATALGVFMIQSFNIDDENE